MDNVKSQASRTVDWKIQEKKKKKKKMVDVVLLWAGPTCQGTFASPEEDEQ